MNSYERLNARLAGRPADRIPNLCILMGFAAKYAGVPYREFCLCPEKMVEANLLCRKDFRTDIVTVMSDPYGEAMDYGMQVNFPENANPYPVSFFWNSSREPKETDLPPLMEQPVGRMAARVETIRQYAARVKGVCPIAGWVEGSVAEYCDLRNINEAMVDFAEEEDFLEDILDHITRQSILYIQAQTRAGADIIGVGDAACSLLGPRLYERYGFPHEKRLIDEIHACGARAKLHICGNITPLLPLISRLKADIVDADWMVDYGPACKILEGASAVSGNFDPVSVMQDGTPESIRAAVAECIQAGNDRCIISSGCEVPPDTPPRNLMAVAEALDF